jgi:hypothetical protein
MLKQNIDFFAVFFIALIMLAFGEVRTWHFRDGVDVIRLDNAIVLDNCPMTRQVLAGLSSILH